MKKLTISEALEYVGGLGKPSKMPCYSYGISALLCKTGSSLRKIEDSVCSICYACKSFYVMDTVKEAHAKRYSSLTRPKWADMMAFLINTRKMAHFRWHDSGDLQGMWHLNNIIKVVNMTPSCQHWLPTKETRLIQEYLKSGQKFPDNLTVRVSSPIIDMRPLKGYENTSTVHFHRDPHGFKCKAPEQEGKCKDCRACWDRSVPNVSYKNH